MIWWLDGALVVALVLFVWAVYIKVRMKPQTHAKLPRSHHTDDASQ